MQQKQLMIYHRFCLEIFFYILESTSEREKERERKREKTSLNEIKPCKKCCSWGSCSAEYFFCFIQEDDCSSIIYIKQLQKKKELAYSNEF